MKNKFQIKNGARNRDQEKGIVLVIVIIIIAVLMILVTDLIYFTQIDTEISSNTRDEIKARYIAKSGVHVAAGTLKARPLEELSSLTAPLDGAENDQDAAGANGPFYASLENPYSIKDGPIDTLQEIRMIDGMDDKFYNQIKDFVTVFPRDKKINFSTAPKAVIIAAVKGSAVSAIEGQGGGSEKEVDDDVAEQIADQIIEERKETPIITQQKAREIAKSVDETSEISDL